MSDQSGAQRLQVVRSTSGSARTPCWPPPCGAFLRASSSRRRGCSAASSSSPASLRGHRLLAALARRIDQPAHRQRRAARRRAPRPAPGRWRRRRGGDLTSTAGLTLLSAFSTTSSALRGSSPDHVHGAVDDLLGDGLLAACHDHVDERGDRLAAVLRIGQDRALRGTFTRHVLDVR